MQVGITETEATINAAVWQMGATDNAWGGKDVTRAGRTIRLITDDTTVKLIVITPQGIEAEATFTNTPARVLEAAVHAYLNIA